MQETITIEISKDPESEAGLIAQATYGGRQISTRGPRWQIDEWIGMVKAIAVAKHSEVQINDTTL